MLRDRLLGTRWLVVLAVAWGVAVAALPSRAAAAPLPPARAGTADLDLETVRAVLEEKVVRDRLLALGLSPADVAAVLQRLGPDERAEVAARAEELVAGGDSLGIAILAVAIILAVIVILVLELIGRRVVSRPA